MRKVAMVCLSALALLLIVGCSRPVINQPKSDDSKASVFLLWEKYVEMHKRLKGIPYTQNEKAREVFSPRITRAGEVKIEVGFAQDATVSHLNPDLRVTLIRFFFDKDMPLREALSAIDEAKMLCADGCSITGYQDSYYADVVVTPIKLTEEQKRIAKEIATKSNSDIIPSTESTRLRAERVVPMIRVFFREFDHKGTLDFENAPIEGMSLGIYDPHERLSLRGRVARLSPWTPKG